MGDEFQNSERRYRAIEGNPEKIALVKGDAEEFGARQWSMFTIIDAGGWLLATRRDHIHRVDLKPDGSGVVLYQTLPPADRRRNGLPITGPLSSDHRIRFEGSHLQTLAMDIDDPRACDKLHTFNPARHDKPGAGEPVITAIYVTRGAGEEETLEKNNERYCKALCEQEP